MNTFAGQVLHKCKKRIGRKAETGKFIFVFNCDDLMWKLKNFEVILIAYPKLCRDCSDLFLMKMASWLVTFDLFKIPICVAILACVSVIGVIEMSRNTTSARERE
jgi:hypothetical protein